MRYNLKDGYNTINISNKLILYYSLFLYYNPKFEKGLSAQGSKKHSFKMVRKQNQII
ncbi:unnamed protein product [Brassica rapa subsp. trilocularis]